MSAWRLASIALTALVLAPLLAGLAGVIVFAFALGPLAELSADASPPLVRFAEEPAVVRSAAISLLTALVSTALSVALTALLLAASVGTRALAVIERVAGPILAVPHAAAALGLVFLLAPSGFLLRLVSPWATGFTLPPDVTTLRDPAGLSLALALVLKETPFLVLMGLAALRQVRPHARLEVAQSLGYGRMAAVLLAVWPLVYRQLRLPVLAVLAFAVSVVDMALIIGPTAPPPLGVRILEWRQSADLGDWSVGAAGALAMMGLVGLSALVWLAGERVAARLWRRLATGGRRFAGCAPVRAVILGIALSCAVLVFMGLAGLVLQSLALYWPFPDVWPSGLSLAAWQRADAVAQILGTTLVIALAATALALPVAIALLEADRRGARVSPLVYLPLVVPQVAFLFGLNVALLMAGRGGGLPAVIVTHAVFAMPYVLVALSGPWAALDPAYERSALALGVARWRVLLAVRLAILSPAILVAAALSVAVSVGLYLPTQLIGAGRLQTVTTEAVAGAMGGDRRIAGVYATLQLLLPALAFALARIVPALLFRHRRGMRVDGAARRWAQ